MSEEEYMECSVVAYPRQIKFLHINGCAISYYVDRHVSDYVDRLQKENQELKKQLEEYQLQNIDLRADIMIQKMAFPNELIKDKTFYDLYDMPSYEELLVQQKEFIKWLEDYLNLFDYMDIQEQAGYDMLEEILQKYREIIGVLDEKK